MDGAGGGDKCGDEAGGGARPKTAIYDMLMDHFELGHIEDLIEFVSRCGREHELARSLIVFKAAASGDKVAREILENVGRSIGGAAKFFISRCSSRGEPVTVALGGSVFMRGTHELHIENVKKVIARKTQPDQGRKAHHELPSAHFARHGPLPRPEDLRRP